MSSMGTEKEMFSKYLYKTDYIEDYEKFKKDIIAKTVVPYQVEIQPGSTSKKICWLECPFCYGKSAKDTGERLPKERYIDLINQIASGGVKKVIFAGWATDPLFYKNIDDLVEVALDKGLIVGFNTRAINLSDRLIDLLTSDSVPEGSYISVSIDSFNNDSYNQVHAVSDNSKLYDRVLGNVRRLTRKSQEGEDRLFVSATYLITQYNCQIENINSFIADFKEMGVDLIRFSFPQIPRGYSEGESTLVFTHSERMNLRKELTPLIQSQNNGSSKVLFVDGEDLFYNERSTPCYARFIYPTIGFDGWLYHCSQSAGSNFHSIALGNLHEKGFWECFYDYDTEDMTGYLSQTSLGFDEVSCRCDRKEHTVNTAVNNSGVF